MTDLNSRVLTVQLCPELRELALRMTMGNETLARQLCERCALRGLNWLFLRIRDGYCEEQAAGIAMAGKVASDHLNASADSFAEAMTNAITAANDTPF